MPLSMTRRAAESGLFVAVATRLFVGLTVDSDSIHNGGWLCALLGAALCLPVVRYAQSRPLRFQSQRAPVSRGLRVLLALLLSLDCAALLRLTAQAACYTALDRLPLYALMLPLLAALLWCLYQGGDAIGYHGKLWSRIALVALVLLLLAHWRSLKPVWLAPLLGSGATDLTLGVLRAAGWLSMLSIAPICLTEADEPFPQGRSALRIPLLASVLSACMILFHLMSVPSFVPKEMTETIHRMDAMLANGRLSLSAQLPLLLLWFISLMQLIAYECSCAAALLKRATASKGEVPAIATVIVIAFIAFLPERWLQTLKALQTWQYLLIISASLPRALPRPGRRGREAAG